MFTREGEMIAGKLDKVHALRSIVTVCRQEKQPAEAAADQIEAEIRHEIIATLAAGLPGIVLGVLVAIALTFLYDATGWPALLVAALAVIAMQAFRLTILFDWRPRRKRKRRWRRK